MLVGNAMGAAPDTGHVIVCGFCFFFIKPPLQASLAEEIIGEYLRRREEGMTGDEIAENIFNVRHTVCPRKKRATSKVCFETIRHFLTSVRLSVSEKCS